MSSRSETSMRKKSKTWNSPEYKPSSPRSNSIYLQFWLQLNIHSILVISKTITNRNDWMTSLNRPSLRLTAGIDINCSRFGPNQWLTRKLHNTSFSNLLSNEDLHTNTAHYLSDSSLPRFHNNKVIYLDYRTKIANEITRRKEIARSAFRMKGISYSTNINTFQWWHKESIDRTRLKDVLCRAGN